MNRIATLRSIALVLTVLTANAFAGYYTDYLDVTGFEEGSIPSIPAGSAVEGYAQVIASSSATNAGYWISGGGINDSRTAFGNSLGYDQVGYGQLSTVSGSIDYQIWADLAGGGYALAVVSVSW